MVGDTDVHRRSGDRGNGCDVRIDPIPAIFAVTRALLVLAANVFALLGLRHCILYYKQC